MPFPESPRIRFGKNPIVEVICQLRFPPILRIDSEPPSDFQERIRQQFPHYQTNKAHLPAGVALPADILQAVLGGSNATTHEFLTADRRTRVVLTRDFIALTAMDYTTWAAFMVTFGAALQAMSAVYQPAFFTRLGLRYRDRIDRRALGLEGTSWAALLRPEIAGELGNIDVGLSIRHILREVVYELPEGAGSLRVVHGLDDASAGDAYIIDADCYTERQIQIGEARDVLANFNQKAGRFFRWCLSDGLRLAMEPHDA